MRNFFSLIVLLVILIPVELAGQQRNAAGNVRQFFVTKQWRDSTSDLFYRTESYKASDMAIVVVDMWDKHWCASMNKKSEVLIPKLNATLDAARELGIKIIFAPSETTDFYKSYPQRQEMLQLEKDVPLKVNEFNPPALPWGRTGGCECSADRPCKEEAVWTRQHEALKIKAGDVISDKADEINAYCKSKGIKTLLFVGEASNMCVTWTRPFSVIPMIRYGYETLVVRDLVEAISGNGYEPDLRIKDPSFTPDVGADSTLKHIEKYLCATVSASQILLAAGKEPLSNLRSVTERMYSKEFVKNYKPRGPTQSFRQLCYDYNWAGREMINLPLKFSNADPVAYAKLSQEANLDAALVLAVPHPGYTTYRSEHGEMFPALQRDWFGEVVQELHKRNISALGYITLGANWKFMREHLGLRQIRSGMEEQGQFGGRGLCLNAPGYLKLVANYSKELLTYYPIDGIRYDFMVTPYGCDCEGCRSYYSELYGQDFTSWAQIRASGDSARYLTFNIETLRRAAQTLHDACKSVKPQVEVWQNHLDPMMEADLNTGRLFDIAYVEYGTPFRLLSLRGILNKKGIIVGQTLKSNTRNLIMALGARCYQYIKVDQETALPTGTELKWVKEDLSGFFKMVSDKQPFLENAMPVSDIGILFSENTRYRFQGYDRGPYMAVCEKITQAYLKKSVPVRFINVLDLERINLSEIKVLLLPLTTGLSTRELNLVKEYVQKGGNLVVVGDALLYDPDGQMRSDFSLAEVMGVRFAGRVVKDNIQVEGGVMTEKITGLTMVTANQGNTLQWATADGVRVPFLHLNQYGRGKVLYMASATATQTLLHAVENNLAGYFIEVDGQKQVVLTVQPESKRWILHLIDNGDYKIRIRKNVARFRKLHYRYPNPTDWTASLSDEGTHWSLTVKGGGEDRLLVLQ